jgi:hypothetical protein
VENNYILKNGEWYVRNEDGEEQKVITTVEDDCMYPAY